MAADYREILLAERDAESPITEELIDAIINNSIAMFEGHVDAPKILAAAFDVGALDQSAIADRAIGQAELKTATGSVSTPNSNSYKNNFVMPGGEYGFYPRVSVVARVGSYPVASIFQWTSSGQAASLATYLRLDGASVTASQRYIQASPPYDLGDGEIPLFIYIEVDTLGNPQGIYIAPEAPFHYNGKTDIRAKYYRNGKGYKQEKESIVYMRENGITNDILVNDEVIRNQVLSMTKKVEVEITQDIKNADKNEIPHPFVNPLVANTIVMLDPVSDVTIKLFELHELGVDVGKMIRDKKVTFGNIALSRAPLDGVMMVSPKLV